MAERTVISLPDPRSPTIAVEIDRDVVAQYRSEAAARGTTVPRLINDILNAVISDQLTRAVLDDDD